MSNTRKLLILDLDETLIHATDEPSFGPAHFRVGRYHVYRRPYLDELLAASAEWFELAVWTSAGSDYAARVCETVIPNHENLRFLWSCNRCTARRDPETFETVHTKNLAKVRRLGYPLEHVLILDDSPEKLAQHYGNLIRVRPYFGESTDTELRDVLPFLHWIRHQQNVREIEKRGWRSFMR